MQASFTKRRFAKLWMGCCTWKVMCVICNSVITMITVIVHSNVQSHLLFAWTLLQLYGLKFKKGIHLCDYSSGNLSLNAFWKQAYKQITCNDSNTFWIWICDFDTWQFITTGALCSRGSKVLARLSPLAGGETEYSSFWNSSNHFDRQQNTPILSGCGGSFSCSSLSTVWLLLIVLSLGHTLEMVGIW